MTNDPITEEKKVLVWIVSPHESGEFDEWWGPCETEDDHAAALAYATARLENGHDQCAPGEKFSVSMESRWVDESDWRQIDEQ